jgi:hypothetical protein
MGRPKWFQIKLPIQVSSDNDFRLNQEKHIEYNQEKGYLLNDNDLIRLGKIKFYFYAATIDLGDGSRYWENDTKDIILTKNDSDLTCKICLDNEVSKEDPMIN